MVTKWGMSDKLGPLAYAKPEREVFLGHSVTEQKNISDYTAKIIDEEIKRLIEEAYIKAKNILNKRKIDLENLAKALLEHETLTGDEIKSLLEKKTIPVKKICKKVIEKKSSIPFTSTSSNKIEEKK